MRNGSPCFDPRNKTTEYLEQMWRTVSAYAARAGLPHKLAYDITTQSTHIAPSKGFVHPFPSKSFSIFNQKAKLNCLQHFLRSHRLPIANVRSQPRLRFNLFSLCRVPITIKLNHVTNERIAHYHVSVEGRNYRRTQK